MNTRKWIFIFLTLLTIVFPLKNFATTTFPYNKVVFFGDSLSDNGNLYSGTIGIIPKSPPYFHGQFSNGEIWSERIADYFKKKKNNIIIENYAVGGETTVWHNPFDGFLPYVLSESLDRYFFWAGSEDKSQTLYFMWIGGNDYLTGGADVDGITTHVVQTIQDSIERLIVSGGKHFIIFNLPDMSKVPEGRDGGMAANVYALGVMHNAKLADTISQLQHKYPNVNVVMYDASELMNEIINNPAGVNAKFHAHITDTYNSCWQGGYAVTQKKIEATIYREITARQTNVDVNQLARHISSSPDLAVTYNVGQSFANNGVPCANPDGYVFWDKVHPTAEMHRMMAESLISFMEQNLF